MERKWGIPAAFISTKQIVKIPLDYTFLLEKFTKRAVNTDIKKKIKSDDDKIKIRERLSLIRPASKWIKLNIKGATSKIPKESAIHQDKKLIQ